MQELTNGSQSIAISIVSFSERPLKTYLSVNLADLHQPTTYLQSDVGRFDLMSYFAHWISVGVCSKSLDGREPRY
jgi:hypothetical protein